LKLAGRATRRRVFAEFLEVACTVLRADFLGELFLTIDSLVTTAHFSARVAHLTNRGVGRQERASASRLRLLQNRFSAFVPLSFFITLYNFFFETTDKLCTY